MSAGGDGRPQRRQNAGILAAQIIGTHDDRSHSGYIAMHKKNWQMA